MSSRIYLDNAATSWPKPESVYQAMDEFQRNVGAAAGRGAYASAQTSDRLVTNLRAGVRRLFDASEDTDVVFLQNGTDALNLCLFGLLQPGDHVITSVGEHNSVIRPLARLANSRDVSVTYVSCENDGILLPTTIAGEIQSNTRLIAITHASNVTGAIQPVHEIASLARDKGALTLVDAAQTAGHIPISVTETPIDMLATSGHKGMCGPFGTGLVCMAPGLAETIQPPRLGGTGVRSESLEPPPKGPERFEAGNLNMAGLAGLAAAVAHQLESGTKHQDRMQQLTNLALESLLTIDGLKIHGPLSATKRVGLVAFDLDGYDCHEVASILDSAFQIEVRAGLHCAPQMHTALGSSGTTRASWSPFTKDEEILELAEALQQIAAAKPASSQ